MNRRSFLFGVGASMIAAPAIVRAASLMPIRGIVMPIAEESFPVGTVFLDTNTLYNVCFTAGGDLEIYLVDGTPLVNASLPPDPYNVIIESARSSWLSR